MRGREATELVAADITGVAGGGSAVCVVLERMLGYLLTQCKMGGGAVTCLEQRATAKWNWAACESDTRQHVETRASAKALQGSRIGVGPAAHGWCGERRANASCLLDSVATVVESWVVSILQVQRGACWATLWRRHVMRGSYLHSIVITCVGVLYRGGMHHLSVTRD